MTVVQGFITQPHKTVPGRGAVFDTVPLEERFWAKVVKTEGCWVWRGSCTGSGRAQINIDGKPRHAARVVWGMTYGEIPTDLHVLHECDNPACVRPDHLFLGTHQDNMADAMAKGRLKLPPVMRGEESPSAKLTWAIVSEIRNNKVDTLAVLAKRYNVCIATIGNIKNHKVWKP